MFHNSAFKMMLILYYITTIESENIWKELLSLVLSNDKLKQFTNEFDVLYSKENNPWIGGLQRHKLRSSLLAGLRAQREFYR